MVGMNPEVDGFTGICCWNHRCQQSGEGAGHGQGRSIITTVLTAAAANGVSQVLANDDSFPKYLLSVCWS